MKAPTIQAIGTAVPDNKISQAAHYAILAEANNMSREAQLLMRRIYTKSGIEHRYSVLPEFAYADNEANKLFHPSGTFPSTPVSARMHIFEQYAAKLCTGAAKDCFRQLPGLQPADVTHLITFSCTGMYAPGLDIELVETLQLQRSVERTCINFMGCYAAINALKAAYHIVRSQPEAVVMLAGVELCTLHYQKSSEANQMVANALFGDGAAVVIVSAKDLGNTDDLRYRLKDFYAEFEQAASQEMVWRIGDVGFDLRLTTEVPNVVRGNIAALMDKLFQKTGMKQEEIDYYAIHPGGVKILEACEEALHISKEQQEVSYGILRDYGNMSSVTILFVLKEYLSRLQTADRNKHVLACAFGPGITMESMVLEIC